MQTQSASIGPHQLLNDPLPSSIGNASRVFFEDGWIELEKARRHATQLHGLTILDEKWMGGPGLSPCWTMTFHYSGQTFLIDSNSHANTSLFIVAEARCPDDILLRLVNHFDELRQRERSIRPFMLLVSGIIMTVIGLTALMLFANPHLR